MKKTENKEKTIQVRMTKTDYELLCEKAKKEQRKIPALIREIVKIYTSV